MVGFSCATEIGHGPQCCSSSPFSLSGWRTVQSAKKLLIVQAGSLYHQRRDGSMDIRLTDNRDSLFVQKGVCCARHNADLTLQGIPALDGNRIAGIFCSQILHGNFQGRNIFQLFRFDLYAHIGIAVRNDVCYLGSFCFCFFISSVSSGSGIGESWMLNFSSSSPSLHMVDQKSNGRGPI